MTAIERAPPSITRRTALVAAEYLGVTVWGTRERIWAGALPVVRYDEGRKMSLELRDLDGFIERHTKVLGQDARANTGKVKFVPGSPSNPPFAPLYPGVPRRGPPERNVVIFLSISQPIRNFFKTFSGHLFCTDLFEILAMQIETLWEKTEDEGK